MTGILIMINNYFHDLSVAVLLVSVLGAMWLGKKAESTSGEAGAELRRVSARFRLIGWLSLLLVIAFGAVRAVNYREFEWNTAVAHGQITALVIKHIVLVTITFLGVYQLVKLGRKIKHSNPGKKFDNGQ